MKRASVLASAVFLGCLPLIGCRTVIGRGVSYTYDDKGKPAEAEKAWLRCRYEISKVAAQADGWIPRADLTRECMAAAGFPVARSRKYEELICGQGVPRPDEDGRCIEYLD